MNFELSDVQRDIQKMCRELAKNELQPNARKWDEQHAWPEAAVKKPSASVVGRAGEGAFIDKRQAV